MQQTKRRLVKHYGLDSGVAQLLVEAGLTTPGKIKRASDRTVSAAVGSENLAAVRAIFPAQE